jgi:hypothetical protein
MQRLINSAATPGELVVAPTQMAFSLGGHNFQRRAEVS